MKNILLYFALFLLVVLLFIPPVFRIFGKDWYKEKKIKMNDSVLSLNCSKMNESLNLTYLNNKPYNLQYLVKGNYKKNDSLSDTNDSLELNQGEIKEESELNVIIDDLSEYSSISYDEIKNVTEFRIDISSYQVIPNNLDKYINNETASTYYASLGFSCTSSVIE